MRSFAYWLTAVVLLLVSGCASSMFSRAGARDNPDPDPQRPGEAKVSDSPGLAGTARIADRTASDSHTASHNASTTEKRTAELLDSAGRSQRAGRLDVARSAYEQVVRLDPQNRTAHFQLACIADDEARFADAERHYAVLMRQTPNDPDLLASLGWSYLLQGKYDACERTLRDALYYAPSHQTALYNLGWLYGTRGDCNQALAIFRSAGSEADAQKALAELQRSARKTPSPAVNVAARGDASSPPAIGGPPVIPAAYSSPASSPKQNTLAGLQQAAINGTATGREMTAPAPWKDGSPTQANHPRQAEPQTDDVGAGRTAAAGLRSESGEPVDSNPPILQGGPIITPATPGRGTAGSRQPGIARNNLPRAGASAPNGNTLESPAMTDAGDPALNPSLQLRLPGRKNTAAGDGAELAALAGPAPRPAGRSWQAAQLTAARLGLSAGPGGPCIPVSDWIDPLPAATSAPSGSTTAPGAESAARPSAAPAAIATGQVPAIPQQPHTNQPAGNGPSGLPASAPPATGLTPRPGGAPVPTAVPTDVTPVAQPPRL
jgi:Flp pilus assembly protein TadD